MLPRAILAAFCLPVALVTGAKAELPRLRPAELQEVANLIVTARVTTADVSTEGGLGSSDWVVILEAEVDAVEKGHRAAKGDTLSVRCWHIKQRPSEWVGASGHGSIPAEGARVRLWLRPHGGAVWEPLLPNGIELLDGSPRLVLATGSVPWWKSMLVLLIVLCAMGGVAMWLVARKGRANRAGGS